MPLVKNLTDQAIQLVLKGKGGHAETVRGDGQEYNINYDPDNGHNKQMIAMRAVEVVSESSTARPAKKAAAKKAGRSRKG